ncbi:hypothetical protein ACH5RR_041256 [Cinchona calisaya]|uniref:Uncharacterized protein n=1 Tax=Cinchona calisaya TaxID=153742 RepID=A0ABD2XTB1_9GENT
MEANDKIRILLNKKEVVLVKPSDTTPCQVLSFSTMDNQFNPERMIQTLYVYRAANNSLDSTNFGSETERDDPALVLKEALSKALVYYFPLAGKVKRRHDTDGRLQLTCTADGVPFLEATAINCHLSSLNFFDGIDHFGSSKQLVFNWPSDSEYGSHPLCLQVTKFSCGGFTIGMGISHVLIDGFGAGMFFRTMTELASGKSEPTIKPVWKREILVGNGNHCYDHQDINDSIVKKPSFVTSQFLPTNEISLAIFDVDDESIRNLKKQMVQELYSVADGDEENINQQQIFTTIEALGAYIWRSRYRALRQNRDGRTILRLATGIRNFIKPPLPQGYYGNAFLTANVELLGRDLDGGPLSKVAKLIKETKKANSKNEQIWKSLHQMEKLRQEKNNVSAEDNIFDGVSLILSDWRRLRLLEEDDFGWKSCVNLVPIPWRPTYGFNELCVFTNPPRRNDTKMKGGVRIYLSLPAAAMQRFNQEMDALKSKDLS